MNRISEDQFFMKLEEPDYSKSVLLDLQDRYQISTIDFLFLFKQGFALPILEKDIEEWLFEYDVFRAADGELNELLKNFRKMSETTDDCDDPFVLQDTLNGQSIAA